ncbi:MAG: diguanylate cyclase, partial [Gammaproteobacteria bacterium]|nr:diguanylate cyclase [Gammaproteobacteria bacterium]
LFVLRYRLFDLKMRCRLLAQSLRQFVSKVTPLRLVSSDGHDSLVQEAFRAGITDVFQRTRLGDLLAYLRDFFRRMYCHDLAGERILLVEDSRTFVQMVTNILQRCGIEVDSVGSVTQARQLLAKKTYHMIIVDLVLEGEESGLSLVRHLRQYGQTYIKLPILVMTSFDDSTRRIELFRAGANDYVPKPLVEAEFLARVHNLLTARKLFERVEEQERSMRELATTDQLTGLGNRHFFFELAARYLARAEREGRAMCMLVADIDHFKQVNDQHGHAVGDKVLRAVGDVLRAFLRKGDLVARFGGEEFVFLMPNCSAEDAFAKAEKIRRDCEHLDVGGVRLTISIGVACFDPGSPESLDSLFGRADKALYDAKRLGRNRVVMHARQIEESVRGVSE